MHNQFRNEKILENVFLLSSVPEHDTDIFVMTPEGFLQTHLDEECTDEDPRSMRATVESVEDSGTSETQISGIGKDACTIRFPYGGGVFPVCDLNNKADGTDMHGPIRLAAGNASTPHRTTVEEIKDVENPRTRRVNIIAADTCTRRFPIGGVFLVWDESTRHTDNCCFPDFPDPDTFI